MEKLNNRGKGSRVSGIGVAQTGSTKYDKAERMVVPGMYLKSEERREEKKKGRREEEKVEKKEKGPQ